jgi:hypothetical protein
LGWNSASVVVTYHSDECWTDASQAVPVQTCFVLFGIFSSSFRRPSSPRQSVPHFVLFIPASSVQFETTQNGTVNFLECEFGHIFRT